MFCCGFFSFFFVALCGAVSPIWPETCTYDWKCGHLDFGGLKFGGHSLAEIWTIRDLAYGKRQLWSEHHVGFYQRGLRYRPIITLA